MESRFTGCKGGRCSSEAMPIFDGSLHPKMESSNSTAEAGPGRLNQELLHQTGRAGGVQRAIKKVGLK